MLLPAGALLLLTACGVGGSGGGTSLPNGSSADSGPFTVNDLEKLLDSHSTIEGRLDGLASGGRVQLRLESSDGTSETLELTRNGGFKFVNELPSKSTYRVTVTTEGDQSCIDVDTGKTEIQRTANLTDSGPIEIHCMDRPPLPTFEVDTSIASSKQVEFVDEFGNSYNVGQVVLGDNGRVLDVVSRKLLVMTSDRPALVDLLDEWNGAIIEELDLSGVGLDGIYMVRIGSRTKASSIDIAKIFQEHAPMLTGKIRTGDEETLQALQFVAEALQLGMKVNMSWRLRPLDVFSGAIADSSDGPAASAITPGSSVFSPDAFQLDYMQTTGIYRTGVAEAWRAMAFAGRLSPGVNMTIFDGGFLDLGDYPDDTTIYLEGTPNPDDCGRRTGCPWHGTQVASVAAAVIDNGTGIAGTGGPVIDKLRLVGSPGSLSDIGEWVRGIVSLLQSGNAPDIINISAAAPIPIGLNATTNGIVDAVTEALYRQGILIVAAAGNDSTNVDALQCDPILVGICSPFEKETWTPCENDYVFCVGGMDGTTFGEVSPGSNFGTKRTNTVDLYAPYTVYAPALTASGRPAAPSINLTSGTSFSSPFVAGVAALVHRALRNSPSEGGPPRREVASLIDTILKRTGHRMSHRNRRSVNALGAVTLAMGSRGETLGTRIRISAPDGTRIAWRGERSSLRLEAYAYRYAGSDDPVNIEWRWEDGSFISRGPNTIVDFSGKPLGSYVIIAQDTAGDERPAVAITVEVVNEPPVATIVTAPLEICAGSDFSLRGLATDPNEPEGMSDSRLVWQASRASSTSWQVLGNGSFINASLSPADTWTIKFVVTDNQGVETSDSVEVAVTECTDSPPQIEIIAPADGSTYWWGETTVLKAVATDREDGDLSDNIHWSTNQSAQHPDDGLGDIILHGIVGHPIGSGSSITVDLVPTTSPHVITALVTDSAGNIARTSILVYVNVKLL